MNSNITKSTDSINTYQLATNETISDSYTYIQENNKITFATNEKQTLLDINELETTYSRKKTIEKLTKKYCDIDSSVLIKANDIMFYLQSLWYFKISIQYTSKKSLFFTLLKSNYEIHLEYLFKENEDTFYSFYKNDNCLEVGNDTLGGSIERIYHLIKETQI